MDDSTETLTQFEIDVLNGLSANRKWLPSKYFYDERGDELFQQIMHLDEYYLTNKELQIFEQHKEAIYKCISAEQPFRIIELGAGDGLKTKILLKHFLEQGADVTYTPVDISGNVLQQLEEDLNQVLPELKVEPYIGEYFDALSEISTSPERDIVFFLGSNVGNYTMEEAINILTKLQGMLKRKDLLFMGVDLKKHPSVILSAYNDAEGVTREFNLNLLDRINQEMDGNFRRNQFLHSPTYNPDSGECRSYLISKIQQEVSVAGEVIHFRPWEAIFMEISKKYDVKSLSYLAEKSGFEPMDTFTDEENWFVDVLWSKSLES